MAWYNKFPWTNFHELNLDWILDIVRQTENVLPNIKTATENAQSAADLANNNAVHASDAATRANIAARKIDPITATAETVYGASASVTVEDTNPGTALHFLIPAGQRGEPGPSGGASDLISNGNFSNPINQRGSSSYNGDGSKKYTIDRWFTTSSMAGAVVVGNRFITVASGATISQIIPYALDGSFPSDTDIGYTAVSRETNGTLHVANSSGLTDSKLSFEIGYANTDITVTLGSGNWEYCALYKGVYTVDSAPGYTAKDYVTQLADCRRYFMPNMFFNCVKTSGSYYSISQNIEMRIVPTYEFLAFSPYGSVNITDFNNCNMTIAQTSDNVQRVTFAELPTCSAHNAGGLAVTLNADM